ncbi:MAG: hypothetical protein R2764_16240 [Bacteroidales bacterium]
MKKLLLIFFCIFLLAFTIGDNKSVYNIPVRPMSIVISDLDVDMDYDIVFGHNFSSQINWGGASILDNVGYGYFQMIDSLYVDNGYPNVNIGYFDNNAYPDIFSQHVIANPYTVYTGIVFNYGQYQFDSLMSFVINFDSPANYLCSGNIDNLNNDDIVFASYQEKKWGILYNDGQNSFSEPINNNLSFSPTDIESEQLNEDDLFDVAIGGTNFTIKFSTGSGFQTLTFDAGVADIEIADIDNDGDNDIIGFDDLYLEQKLPFSRILETVLFTSTKTGTLHRVVIILQFRISTMIPCQIFSFMPIPIMGCISIITLVALNLIRPFSFHLLIMVNPQRKSVVPILTIMDTTTCNRKSHGTQLPVGNVTMLFNDGLGNFVEDPITGSDTPNPELQTPNLVCYPNPFTVETTISFIVEDKESVQVHILRLTDN